MGKQAPRQRSAKTRSDGGLSAGHREYLGRSRRMRHAEAAQQDIPVANIPDHPLICADDTELITEQGAFDDLIEKLRQTGRFAFDTEFIGEQSYYPYLCLIQVATESLTAVVDTVVDLDIGAFWDLVADETVEKIVHAGGQDLEPAQRITGRPAVNVFDTQIAAGFAGLPYPLNLRELVLKFTGVRLHKSSGFTQWDARPLTETQLRYAADDVRYLLALRQALTDELTSRSVTGWADEEMAQACIEASRPYDARRQALRMKGARDLSGRQLAVLAELLDWRELYAAECNAPARALVSDDSLRAMARKNKTLKSITDLHTLGAVSGRVLGAVGDKLMSAINRGKKADKEGLRANIPSQESAATRQAIDYLWVLVQAVSFAASVHPSLVSSRKELANILSSSGRKSSEGKDLPDLTKLRSSDLGKGWRGVLLKGLLGKLDGKGAALPSVVLE